MTNLGRFQIIFRVWVLSLVLACPFAYGDQFDKARLQIRDVMAYWHVPSASVAVAYKGQIIWEEAFGWANVAKRIPATAHTTYSLASVSKPVTATALMVLVEGRSIDLDKPINNYLGAQKLVAHLGNVNEATVRRIADHTAGLPLHALFFYEDEGVARPSMEETIRRYGTLVTPPGESFIYSNFDYGLLEYAIERVSGKSYAAFVRDEVFAPLGLSESAINGTPDLGAQVAVRYWADHPVPNFDFDNRGAAAVFMSAYDLVRFGMFHLQGHLDGQKRPLLRAATLTLMRTSAPLRNGDANKDYGIGWEMGQRHGLKWFGHGGGMAGVAAILSIYPDDDLVVVVLSNGVSPVGAVHFLENDIVHAVLPKTIRNDHGFKPKTALVGTWIGDAETYAKRTPVALDIREDGSVFVRFGAASAQEVETVSLDEKANLLSLDNMRGDIGSPDADHYPHKLQLALNLRGPDKLSGSVCANSFETLPDRMGDALCYWVELRRHVRPKPQ